MLKAPFRLYKIHENTDCEKLLWFTRYMHSLGFDLRPTTIHEKNFPADVKILPAIRLTPDGPLLSGYNNILDRYAQEYNLENLKQSVEDFRSEFPNYHIH